MRLREDVLFNTLSLVQGKFANQVYLANFIFLEEEHEAKQVIGSAIVSK
jgi:hypothetical protein